jgi:hypothetical protein
MAVHAAGRVGVQSAVLQQDEQDLQVAELSAGRASLQAVHAAGRAGYAHGSTCSRTS